MEPAGDTPRDNAWDAALGRPDDLVRGPSATGFTARLQGWVAEGRVAEAALQRTRERWLREVAEQEATLAGVLADLAERRAGMTIAVGGRRHHGHVTSIGLDFLALRPPAGPDVLVALRAVTVVRPAPALEVALGDRTVSSELRLADVLAELAADRERVRLVTVDGEALAGGLRSVGHDIAVLRTDGEPPGAAYVALGAIAEVAIG